MTDIKNKNGQSTLEILIALAILTISLSTIIIVAFGNQSVSIDTENSNQALYLAEENLETAKANSKNDLSSVVNNTTTVGIYTKSLIVEDVSSSKKKVTSRVTWSTDPLRTQKVELVTYITGLIDIPPLGSNCSSDPLTGNWASPVVLGSGDIGSGNIGTDVAVALPYAYVSSTSTTSSNPDIFAFNVSNPASPQLIGSLDIGSEGINSIFVKGNYLYAASSNDSKEFIIINITNPVTMIQTSSLNLSGTANGLGVMAFGSSSAAVGRVTSSNNELYFINATNPALPTTISSTNVLGDVNDFAVGTQYIYAVSSAADEDIWVYDITNPLSPSFVSNYDLPDGVQDISIGFQPAGQLYLGNLANKLEAVNATNPQNMTWTSSYNTNGSVYDFFCVVGDLGFLATGNSTKEFLIIDINNPAAMTQYGYLNFSQPGSGIDYVLNKVYMSIRDRNALKIITSQ